MAIHMTSDGRRIHYDLVGTGPTIVLTPGGREAKERLGALVRLLAAHCRVLIWDRANTGQSDLLFDESRSEQDIWSADLVELVEALDIGPAVFAGGSAGSRVSINTVLRRPEAARKLTVWSASGGNYGSQFLGYMYHVPFIVAAQRGGMTAVVETPFFAARIEQNPDARAQLMSVDPDAFIATMKRWNESFYPRDGVPLAGIEGDLASITVPALIFEGNDEIHPAESSQALAAAIPGARLVASPWSNREFMDLMTGHVTGTVFDLYPRLAPELLAFVD